MSLDDYLEELGSATPIKTKSQELFEYAKLICPEEITDFFVSEYATKDGAHVLDSLVFFSNKYCIECKKILSSEYNLDIACLFGNIERFEITYENYNPQEPDKTADDSKIRIEGFSGNWVLQLKASKNNCSRLFSIIMKYFKPNLIEIIERD